MTRLLIALLAVGLVLPAPISRADDKSEKKTEQKENKENKDKKENKGSDEKPIEPKDVTREVNRILRELQFSLEGGSTRGVLSLIDSAKFDDYPRFEDNVERLLRDNVIRAHFRPAATTPSPAEGKAQTMLDAEMELSRKDSTGAPSRRRDQLVLDFERTRRGWRIINITPRTFFNPY